MSNEEYGRSTPTPARQQQSSANTRRIATPGGQVGGRSSPVESEEARAETVNNRPENGGRPTETAENRAKNGGLSHNWAKPGLSSCRRLHPFLSVVLPAYNEEDSIGATVRRVDASLAEVCDSYEIIAIDDGSDDTTRQRLRDVSEDVRATRFVRNEENRGKGHAIRDGCRGATGEYILLMDADGDLTPERITGFIERAEETGADVVVGSKRHPDSDVIYPLKRRILSKSYSVLIRTLFGLQVTDTQVGMKLLHREAVQEVMPLLLVERYAFDVELLALLHKHGYEVAEAPVSLDFNGNSSIDWGEVGRIGWDTVAVFTRLKLLGSYEKIERGVTYARERRPTLQEEQP